MFVDSQAIILPDGRRLGYCTVGKGKAVVYFHGTASSRLETLLLKGLAESAGLEIIGVDRAGYGLSTFQSRENLQNFNADINFLAKSLGVDKFGVLGWSGGGVFALAYLAQHPQNVTKAVIAGTPALPFDASTAHNMPLARFAVKIPFVGYFAVKRMSQQVLKADGDIHAFLNSQQGKQMLHACSKSDLKFFSEPTWMTLMYQAMAEAFRQGNAGVKAVVAEHEVFLKPWSFSFSRIPEGKLLIFQGSEDKTCPASNGKLIWRSVKGSELEIVTGQGHCVLFENFARVGKFFSAQ